MAKQKEIRTNAMRQLERAGIACRVVQYDCSGFTDGVTAAHMTGIPVEQSFKTLVTKGHSGSCHVFVIPVAEEPGLKAAARADPVPEPEIQ